MGRDEDGRAAIGEIVDELPETAPRHWVHAGSRLVEEYDGRLVEDRAAQGKPLLEARARVRVRALSCL